MRRTYQIGGFKLLVLLNVDENKKLADYIINLGYDRTLHRENTLSFELNQPTLKKIVLDFFHYLIRESYNKEADKTSPHYKEYEQLIKDDFECEEVIERNITLLKNEFLKQSKCDGNELEKFILGTRVFIAKELILINRSNDLNYETLKDLKTKFDEDDLKYLVLNKDGSATLLNKDSSMIRTESYSSQEVLIALLIHFCPEKIFVYDELKLLKPELAFTLKRNFGNGVEFLIDKHPIHNN